MTKATENKIRKGIIALLKSKKVHEKEIDFLQIDNIIYNLKAVEIAKKKIDDLGDEDFNHYPYGLAALHNCMKSINSSLKQLGLDKTKIEPDTKTDTFQALMEAIK